MADDTRQNDGSPTEEQINTRPPRRRPKHDFPQTQAGKMEAAFGNPKDPANAMPGGTYNSAGGKPAELRWWDAMSFETFNSEKRPAFYKTGCARDSMLVGMGAGGVIGGLRFIVSGLSAITMTTNLAVGGFGITSLMMYYWCDQRRKQEARGMAAAIQGMKLLNEKKAREEAEAGEARKAAAEKLKKKSGWWW